MPTQDDINSLQARLTSDRRTLGHYLRQRAMLSGPFEPPGIAAGIAEARHEIARDALLFECLLRRMTRREIITRSDDGRYTIITVPLLRMYIQQETAL